jgi:hypothetical protein
MGLNIDISRTLRGSHRLDELVQAIYAADSSTTSETHWLEWKRSLDFATPKGKVTAAKAIIAFANRDPDNAARACDSEAYLVVGVSPDQVLDGAAVYDIADLEGMLKTYVDGPHWDADYVEFQGKHVLVITVAPPSPGDRIHSLVKDYDNYLSGTVFLRGVSTSKPATHRELNDLQHRLLQDPPVSDADTFSEAIGSGNYHAAGGLIRNALRRMVDECGDPQQFPPRFASRVPVEQISQYVEIAGRYLTAVAPVLALVVEGCRVETAALDRQWRHTVSTLAEPRPLLREPGSLITEGRDERLEALALLPATLVMYAGTLAAIEHDNYTAVRALTIDAIVDWSVFNSAKISVLEKAGPWELVAHERQLGIALRATQEGKLTPDLLHALAAGRVPPRPAYPVSAFLCDALRPYFSDHTDSRYTNLFDSAELLFSLLAADQMAQRSNPYLDQPWLGLFVTHAAQTHPFENTDVARTLHAAANDGDQWPPVQAGLFAGSGQRLQEAVKSVLNATIEQTRRSAF